VVMSGVGEWDGVNRVVGVALVESIYRRVAATHSIGLFLCFGAVLRLFCVFLSVLRRKYFTNALHRIALRFEHRIV